MQEEIESLVFAQGVDFELIDSLNNNDTKIMLTFEDSCEEICISIAFLDFASARSSRGLSTIDTKHNLFHQSKLGRDSGHQNTHIVLFNNLRDVMPVSALSAPFGLGSELIDWY